MKRFLSQNLINLSNSLTKPLYIVGGFVRNFLICNEPSKDIDLASSVGFLELSQKLKEHGFKIIAEYKRTGTIVFSDGNQKYEFTAFRTDEYETGGKHLPENVNFTDDIVEDARRRDFKCNAVYYDVKDGKIVDPLGGVDDIKNRVLDTVKSPFEVFSHDGLRLMRLARFCAELNFTPKEEVILGAKENAFNITEISAERIYAELKYILESDQKYSFSDKSGHYNGLKILSKTGVLDLIIPELTLGKDMAQSADFHACNVLEHTFKCVLYSPKEVRFSALLFGVGKEKAWDVLKRLKVDKKTTEKVLFNVENHMLDLDLKLSENELRLFIVKNKEKIDDLLKLKQADFISCKCDLTQSPTVVKWNNVLNKMREENVPFSIKELKISAKELTDLGFFGKQIGQTLDKLLEFAVINPKINQNQKLMQMAITILNK